MNFKELKELIDLFTSRETIEELEVERSGVRVKMRRQGERVAPVAAVAVPAPMALPGTPPAIQAAAPSEDLFIVTAPIVGTFYKAANPTSPPFANVGDFVEKGTVLCIVEAMKLMNEIEAEVAGQVMAVFVENGQPVEYGEKLFAIKRK